MSDLQGRVHSLESFGTLDGPGVRYIVFLQGCPLRCCYCHNPDTWQMDGGTAMSVEEVMSGIVRCRSYIKNGGVTLSGGEPLVQAEFSSALLDACRKEGFHTALDTAGSVPLEISSGVISKADMLLLDIKSLDDELCIRLTGRSNRNTLETLRFCEEHDKPVWIRHVVVPGWTADVEKLKELSAYLEKFNCIRRIDLLPYHKFGEYKWEQLGVCNILTSTDAPSKDEMAEYNSLFSWCALREQ